MKKQYLEPSISLFAIGQEDILTLSNGGTGSGDEVDWDEVKNA